MPCLDGAGTAAPINEAEAKTLLLSMTKRVQRVTSVQRPTEFLGVMMLDGNKGAAMLRMLLATKIAICIGARPSNIAELSTTVYILVVVPDVDIKCVLRMYGENKTLWVGGDFRSWISILLKVTSKKFFFFFFKY